MPRVILALLCMLSQSALYARGVSPYLPLNLDPEVEREVERVMILGGRPVMTRPIPAAAVLEALPRACAVDAVLCGRVRRALERYMHDSGAEFFSAQGAHASGNGASIVIPNQHGQTEHSAWQVAGAGYVQPSDYLLLNIGGVAYDGRQTATGSVLSVGFDWAQLDLGYRDRWWSPLTDSSMLVSTEAPTMPSISLSNYAPLTRLGWQYEVFLAKMSYSDKIELTNGTLTKGNPKFAGARLAIEPANSGWSLAGNRIVVFGGGAAGGQSVKDVLQAFFNPSKAQTTGFGKSKVIGKQEAAITSRYIYPGRIPFSLYVEYAGNDTAGGNNIGFSKTDLSVGLQFPRLGPFDLTYELSEWQPTWYVHGFSAVQTGYGDGITNYRRNIGHWFGDQRQFGDAVGGQTNMLRVGWEPRSGGRLEATLRTLTNDSYYSAIAYKHEFMGSLMYSHPWKDYVVGSEVDYGRDVFGERYTRIAAFLRFGDALRSGDDDAEESGSYTRPEHAEAHVDAGVVASSVVSDIAPGIPRVYSGTGYGPHLALGARTAVSEHQDLGAALEADDVHGASLVSVRIIDYRYRFNNPLALNLFAGAARYAKATPAYGVDFGAGLQWRDVLPHWDVGVDYRYAKKVDRVRTLPTEPRGDYRGSAYYDISLVTLYLSRKF